jgi:hypothetical protein
VFKDVVNTFILLSIFIILSLFVKSKSNLEFFKINLVYFNIIFAIIVAIFGLLGIFDVYELLDIPRINQLEDPLVKYFNSIDYNFALLPVFFGIFGLFYVLIKTKSKFLILLYNLLLIIFSFDIILSGSRRGLLSFTFIFLILIFMLFFSPLMSNLFFKRLIAKSKIFIISFIALITLLVLVFPKTPYGFKYNTLKVLGAKEYSNARLRISVNIYRCLSAIDKHLTLKEIDDKIWTNGFDPKYPGSGWGSRIHKISYPLTGENVQIVPKGALGYLLDSTCNASPGKNYCDGYSLLVDFKGNEGDLFMASVYCFVSDNFDGDIVRLGVGTDYITKNIVFGKPTSNYDLKEKGIWKKLEINFGCIAGNIPIYLSFIKKGVKDFSKLKGYVIFAYPQFEKTCTKTDSLSVTIIKNEINKQMTCSQIEYNEDVSQIPIYKYGSYFGEKLMNDLLDKARHSDNHKQQMTDLAFMKYQNGYVNECSISYPFSLLLSSAIYAKDGDPIRRWASSIVNEDTIYHAYKANIVLDTTSNPFFDDRVLRWEFALQVYSKEYNWRQKIFGGGFNFLNWYGYYFLKDKTLSDWPHNPFISIFLYSGIIGLLIYCFFIYKVFYYYLKYIKEYPLLFIFFSITFFFSFFSGGSPFDPPIMGFFSILPFFIHSIHKRDTAHLETKELTNE